MISHQSLLAFGFGLIVVRFEMRKRYNREFCGFPTPWLQYSECDMNGGNKRCWQAFTISSIIGKIKLIPSDSGHNDDDDDGIKSIELLFKVSILWADAIARWCKRKATRNEWISHKQKNQLWLFFFCCRRRRRRPRCRHRGRCRVRQSKKPKK